MFKLLGTFPGGGGVDWIVGFLASWFNIWVKFPLNAGGLGGAPETIW